MLFFFMGGGDMLAAMESGDMARYCWVHVHGRLGAVMNSILP